MLPAWVGGPREVHVGFARWIWCSKMVSKASGRVMWTVGCVRVGVGGFEHVRILLIKMEFNYYIWLSLFILRVSSKTTRVDEEKS